MKCGIHCCMQILPSVNIPPTVLVYALHRLLTYIQAPGSLTLFDRRFGGGKLY